MKRLLFYLNFVLLSNLCSANPITTKYSGFIVEFTQSVETDALKELSHFKFSSIEALNPEKTIYKFDYDSKLLAYNDASYLVNHLPYYLRHEDDDQIKFRATTPNDTLYPYQWHLPLIKANLAWDITRSGINRRGDTIVIAVIDDGLHIKHPDFQGNIWINYADTISNGKDDDGNGFIDDTYGWNFMGINNDISDSSYYKGKHGTPVAGIIGAKTNNVTGVSGIMWNVKLMIVNITDTGRFPATYQSDVIKAYSYVLHQRKLYNQTNGAKGAFVVATNSSWGIDRKFPNQAPLWCSFYDTLGKYGILNVSAASNAQELIDTYGDLPSLCPSNHLIVVGNSTRYDNDANAGFSTTHVDLSAPGNNIFTSANYTKQNITSNTMFRDGYYGTSFAAPMVTAAVGILNAHACERVLDSIKLNPAKGTLIIKHMILSGVDIVPALNGKNATSGRLNIQKALKVLDQYCLGEVGVSSIKNTANVELYPNPGLGQIELLTSEDLIGVECYNYTGQSVGVQLDEKFVNIEQLSDGIYYFKVTTNVGTSTLKYVKISN